MKFAFQSENNLYLGMEYLSGGNLKQLIQRFGTLPEDWVVFYAAELVLAISHLHSLQVLYRCAWRRKRGAPGLVETACGDA